MNGYPIATEALDLEIYILASLFAGSHALSDIEHDHQGLRWARTTFESSEASRRLVGLAVMLRNQVDASGRKPDAAVGVLIPDVSRPSQRENLSLREACNKIIHAASVDLFAGQHPSESPLSHMVILEGTHRDQEWRAELDAFAFLSAASNHF